MKFIDRFKSADGRRLLVDALLKQTIISGDRSVAEKFAEACALEEFARDSKVIEQGASDNDIYFIIGGRVKILVNGREVNQRVPGQHVGEMALIDPLQRRMGTVLASEDTVVARVSEAAFSKIANEHGALWRHLAIEIGDRLRQRSRFIKDPNPQPHVFIGSSRESLAVAEQIQKGLSSEPISVYLWTDDIFVASEATIESLEAELLKADFAILVLGPDDQVTSRGRASEAPRDNVIFELGLFMGALTRKRTFFVKPRGLDIKIPSDLFGVTPLEYDPKVLIFDDVCLRLKTIVHSAGPK